MLALTEIEQLSAEEIEILLTHGQDILDPDDLLNVQLFIQRIGGLENAFAAVKMLKSLEYYS